MLQKPVWQELEASNQYPEKTEVLTPTTYGKVNLANHVKKLGSSCYPVEPCITTAPANIVFIAYRRPLANTLIAALWESLRQRTQLNNAYISDCEKCEIINVCYYKQLRFWAIDLQLQIPIKTKLLCFKVKSL